jgi:hypothetical protein
VSENPILMTQAEYARHRNKSPRYIGKLYKAGILVMRGRLVEVAASDAVLDDKPSEETTMDGQPPASYAQARLADMVFRAKLRRLEFDTRQGKLVEAAVVKERWAAILVVIKERVLGLCPLLANLKPFRRARPVPKHTGTSPTMGTIAGTIAKMKGRSSLIGPCQLP